MTREQLASLESPEILFLSHLENPDSEKAYLTAISALFSLGYARAALDLKRDCFVLFGRPTIPPPVGILYHLTAPENQVLVIDDGKLVGKIANFGDVKG